MFFIYLLNRYHCSTKTLNIMHFHLSFITLLLIHPHLISSPQLESPLMKEQYELASLLCILFLLSQRNLLSLGFSSTTSIFWLEPQAFLFVEWLHKCRRENSKKEQDEWLDQFCHIEQVYPWYSFPYSCQISNDIIIKSWWTILVRRN